jgi:CheY-like chemotaxis protein
VERIFDPFFTTKAVHEGTGLGLSIVQGIVLSHGGALSVDTAPGEGATFNIFFPIQGGASKTIEVPVQEAAGGRESILVVDDEVPVGQVVKRLLESQGYHVTLAHGPDEALRLLVADPSFDLVITDQTMPSMTGLELASRIRQSSPQLPVILITGFSRVTTPEQLLKAGIAASMTKPFSGRELASCVRGVLDVGGS